MFLDLAGDSSKLVRTGALQYLGRLISTLPGEKVSQDLVSYFTGTAVESMDDPPVRMENAASVENAPAKQILSFALVILKSPMQRVHVVFMNGFGRAELAQQELPFPGRLLACETIQSRVLVWIFYAFQYFSVLVWNIRSSYV